MLTVLWLTKSTVSFPLEDKHVVNERHVERKSHDATQKKCPHVVYFNVSRDWFKINSWLKNVTLKKAKKFESVAVYWEQKQCNFVVLSHKNIVWHGALQ